MGRPTRDQLDERRKIGVTLDWNKELAVLSYLNLCGLRYFSSTIKLTEHQIKILIAAYILNRPFNLKDLESVHDIGKAHLTEFKTIYPLMARGLIIKTREHKVRFMNGSDPHLFYITYEGKVIIDAYFGCIAHLRNKYIGMNLKQFFSQGTLKMMETGFKYYVEHEIPDVIKKNIDEGVAKKKK